MTPPPPTAVIWILSFSGLKKYNICVYYVKENDIPTLEKKLGAGQIEEVIKQVTNNSGAPAAQRAAKRSPILKHV